MIEIQLEQLLNGRGMTAYALAKQAGLHQSVIAKFRHNEAKAVRLDVLEKICNALGCEPGELLVRVAASDEQPMKAAKLKTATKAKKR